MIADVLGQNVVLGDSASSLAALFDAVEPFALGLKGGGRRPRDRDLLRYIGDTLLTRHEMVAAGSRSAEPDMLWSYPRLTACSRGSRTV